MAINNFIIPSKDFPTEKYLEMTGICASINQKTSDLFCFYHQTSFLRGSDNQWQNDTKLKIEQLISKFSNNKLLLDSLSIGIKGIKDHIISQVDKYNESTFTYPKIDVFPLLNFINEKLDDLNKKIEKELTIKDNESISLEPAKSEIENETTNFINNFDNISTDKIYKHFKAGLVDKHYLTEQELNNYLKAAFELKTIPETRFKLKHTPTKQKIYTVFYTYYKDISPKIQGSQEEYAALLGDYFERR